MLKAILAGAASAMALTFAAPAFAEPPSETQIEKLTLQP